MRASLRTALCLIVAMPLLMVGCTCSRNEMPPPPPGDTVVPPNTREAIPPGEPLPGDEALPNAPDDTSPDEVPPSDILPESPE